MRCFPTAICTNLLCTPSLLASAAVWLLSHSIHGYSYSLVKKLVVFCRALHCLNKQFYALQTVGESVRKEKNVIFIIDSPFLAFEEREKSLDYLAFKCEFIKDCLVVWALVRWFITRVFQRNQKNTKLRYFNLFCKSK